MKAADFAPALTGRALAEAAEALAQHGFVHLADVLDPAAASQLLDWLAGEAEWWRAINQGEKLFDLGPEAIAALAADPGKANALSDAINQGAREGFQFAFDNIRIAEDAGERAARALPIDALLDAFNGEEWLTLLRRILGTGQVDFVDGQATRYLPGHLLTAHDDAVEGKQRLAAYVLGLTPKWRTEWGGLLMFHCADGDIERALLPRFNAINLFKVPRPHSVSPVAPFAGAPRYSVTGWLRSRG